MEPPRLTGRAKLEAEGLFTLKKQPGDGMCCVQGCRNRSAPRRKVGATQLCDRHWQQRWRMLNPKRSAYTALRDHAKARGIEFTLTYDYFLGLTDAYGYFEHQADSHGDVLSIDRVDATRGYLPGNVRIVTVSENALKGNRERFLPEHVQAVLDRKRARMTERTEGPDDPDDPDVCPF